MVYRLWSYFTARFTSQIYYPCFTRVHLDCDSSRWDKIQGFWWYIFQNFEENIRTNKTQLKLSEANMTLRKIFRLGWVWWKILLENVESKYLCQRLAILSWKFHKILIFNFHLEWAANLFVSLLTIEWFGGMLGNVNFIYVLYIIWFSIL